MATFLPIIPEQQMEYASNVINMTSYEHQASSLDRKISKLTDLSMDLIREIFDYLPLGDIYYSFYEINLLLKNFIDNCFITLNLTSMSYRQFIFYCAYIPSIHIDHGQNIHSIILSNRTPFNQIEGFFPLLHFYTNLNKLYLYSPNEIQLKRLSSLVPHLYELYIIFQDHKTTNNLKWLSSLRELRICSIDSKINGMEIDQSMHSLSQSLSSLSIILSSTYDFYTLLSLLPYNTLQYLKIGLYDNKFSYSKTAQSPTTHATKLIDFSFNMSLKAMTDASCLYDIIRFVSNTLRSVQIFTIICRLADGILINENKLRDYLSLNYSVNKYNLYIEMNNLPESTDYKLGFDQSVYTYPFWIDKGVNINVYRNKNNQIKRVRIYTLPLVSAIINIPNYSEGTYKLIESSSCNSNIHQFILNDLDNQIFCLDNDLTLIPNRIYSSSDISLFPYLSRLSLLEVTKNDMEAFLTILAQNKSYLNIRKLQLDHLPVLFLKQARQMFNIFPCLQSLSIGNVDDFDIFYDILNEVLVVLPSQQVFIHLSIGGLYFDEVCPKYVNEKALKSALEEIFIPLCNIKNAYNVSFNQRQRYIDMWF